MTAARRCVLTLALAAIVAAPAAVPATGARTASATVSRPLYVTKAPIVMLKDMDSGAILFARGTDRRFAPASMAKVMTAYVVIEMIERGALAPDRRFTMSEELWRRWNGSNGGSTMFIRAGEAVSVDRLLQGLITVSGNDAAALLAVGVDGSEDKFVKRMNDVAADIGMTSSRFGSASGWPDGGITQVSAADLVTLAERLIRDHPEAYARYFSRPRLAHGKAPDGTPIVQPNRNPILGRFDGADGLKTGHTAEAGYCFLGSAKRGGRRLIMVVAGMDSEKARRDEAERLMRWGFDQWESRQLGSSDGGKLGVLDVDGGARPTVDVGLGAPVRMTVPKGHSGAFRAVMRARAPLRTPVRTGERVAELHITPEGLPAQTMPLYAIEGVDRGGWFARGRTGFYRAFGA